MLDSPEFFVKKYKNSSYLDLLKLKNEFVAKITEFETDFYMQNEKWYECPSASSFYKWNLEVLSLISHLLKKAFNKEYIWGKKKITDYYEDMKKFYRES